MKIGLIDLDSKLSNIALEKIRLYYSQNGNSVDYITPIEAAGYDKVYCSSIYTFTDKHYMNPSWICGGTGFDLTTNLPPEIENMKPKINIGFTTRGCIRKCPFCVVPQKEGKIRVTGNIYDFWDGISKDITLLDNNILALPKHFEFICKQIRDESLRVDFNQGLDCRLMNEKTAGILSTIKKRDLRFAFDNISYKKSVIKTIEIANKYGWHNLFWYVYTDGNFDDAMKRLLILKSYKQRPYLMRDISIRSNKKMIQLARWVNQQEFFQSMDFHTYDNLAENRTK